jgi:uncharacterized membrane protein YhaH (DUF805 family)
VVVIAVVVFTFWTGLATAVKRLHDRNKSGWWILVFWLLPGVINAIGNSFGEGADMLTALVGFGISVWGFIEIACLKGTTGPNDYGPDPLPPPTA